VEQADGVMYTGPKLSKLGGKYRPLVPVLRGLVLRPDTPLDPQVKGNDHRPARHGRGQDCSHGRLGPIAPAARRDTGPSLPTSKRLPGAAPANRLAG
jgi:hypothetical protein